ncbi:GGDEF domain-containing protein [Massilia sp. YIM B02769]|uniref:GGDEF domain-containing protein n=1 Tax=unclassified Massilia TaxID=2609279 RepID=UPI0025B69BFC|nr:MULTISPECIES: GGDEF domain-containing protein [unclassified Massilia]MDN4059491.1 GGDEF domain-containing protein [Massilia sp. YIM B02769]
MKHIGKFGQSGHKIDDLQLFRGADMAAAARSIAECDIVRVTEGELIEDTVRARLYIVLSGMLEVETDGHAGTSDGNVNRILPGESVGEQSVLDDAVNLDAVRAVEETTLLVIESELAWELIDHSNAVARNLLRLLSFRIRAANALLRRRQKLGEFYRQLSLNDTLTGLYNRTWLADMLPKLVGRARAQGSPLALLMVDLDNFKKFNDTHGHLVGDAALCAAANVIRDGLRPSDFAVRYGGEELMAVLPDTNAEMAHMVANRLCQKMRETVLFPDMRVPMPHLTACFGVAVLDPSADETALIEAADAALYRAKEAGRNCVSL